MTSLTGREEGPRVAAILRESETLFDDLFLYQLRVFNSGITFLLIGYEP